MKTAFLIILSNGQSYSDHQSEPVQWCATQEIADLCLAAWKRWLAAINAARESGETEKYYFSAIDWAAKNPPPCSMRDLDGWGLDYSGRHEVAILPIPGENQ